MSTFQFSHIGVALVLGAVLAEAIQGNLQERLLSSDQLCVPPLVVLCATNAVACVMCVLWVFWTGEVFRAFSYLADNQFVVWMVLAEALVGYAHRCLYLLLFSFLNIVSVISVQTSICM
jgi:hypothetical protein